MMTASHIWPHPAGAGSEIIAINHSMVTREFSTKPGCTEVKGPLGGRMSKKPSERIGVGLTRWELVALIEALRRALTAGASGFLNFSQSGERPDR
jgi:hypothetical protein